MTRIAVFVDVQNIYYTVKQAYASHFNYSALWSEIAASGDIILANAYAIDRVDARQKQFQQILRDIGFNVKLKPFIQRADGSAKGDWDVGITLDVMEHAALVDKVVLVSGDGDFDLLMDRIKSIFHVQTVVYGVPSLTAASLINAATEFHAIEGKFLVSGR